MSSHVQPHAGVSVRASRDKGARGEREVAALLTQWWGVVEPGCRFVRTPGSGGWQNPAVRGEFRASGDLTTTAARFPFCVEVKRREGWAPVNVRDGKPSPVWAWWEQARREAHEAGLEPMLWLRRSREPWRVAVSFHRPAGAAVRRYGFESWGCCAWLVPSQGALVVEWETLRALRPEWLALAPQSVLR